jgi:hypothetical protein
VNVNVNVDVNDPANPQRRPPFTSTFTFTLLVYAVLLLAVYWQLWTPIDGARGAWRYDPRHEYWGDLQFQAERLRHGALALWNPYDRAGFPLHGDPQPGLLYPPNWPLVVWGALTGDVPFGLVSLKILGHALFGALGMHLLARRLGAGPAGSYAAGVLVTFTSPRLRYGGSALNWSVAWIPWLALAALELVERPSWRRAVVLGATAAMVLLAGAPAVVLYAALCVVPLALWRGGAWRTWRALAPLLALAGVSFALLVAPLVVSNLEMLPASVREARDLDFVTRSAFTPAGLVGYLVPRLSSENPYVSLVPLLGAVALVTCGRRRLAAILLATAAAGVLLALGEHAGVLPAAASALPPFGLFRQAHRYLYVASFALALLAGLGLAAAQAELDDARRARLARRVAWLGGLATFALAIGAITAAAVKPDGARTTAFALATVSSGAITALFLAVVRLAPGRRAIAAGLIAGVVFVDLWTANSEIVRQGMTPPPAPANDARVAELAGVPLEYRIYDHALFDYRPGTRLGLRDFGGYVDDPLGLSRYQVFRRAADNDAALLGHANVRYLLEGDPKRPMRRPRPEAGRRLADGVTELVAVAPAVFWVASAERVDSAEAAMTRLARFAPGHGAVIEVPAGAPPPAPATAPAAAPVAGRLVELDADRLVAEIEAPAAGLVLIAEAYFAGWRATVDGVDAPIYPANVLSRAVPVTAGRHRIEMRFVPLRFWVTFPMFLIGLAILVVAVGVGRGRRSGSGLETQDSSP